MHSLTVASIVFAFVFGGALLGMLLRSLLPADHLSSESKDVVKLGTGLIATMAALVLGLLTASAKGAFDAQTAAVKQAAAELIVLDRTLAEYGPETTSLRRELHDMVAARVQQIWPDGGTGAPQLEPGSKTFAEQYLEQLRGLKPTDERQNQLKAKALQLTDQLLSARWLVFTQAASSAIPLPFLVVVVLWLTLIFGSFGLLAAPNPTVAAVLALSALSVAGALFLILEMDTPFEGVLRISSDPMHFALAHLGQ